MLISKESLLDKLLATTQTVCRWELPNYIYLHILQGTRCSYLSLKMCN